MRFFPYELIAAGNGWSNETTKEQDAASRRFERAVKAYHRYLDRVHPKVPTAVWNFFRHGNPDNTLHDSRLANMTVGDVPLRLRGPSTRSRRRVVTRVRLEFLTYSEDRLYVFDCQALRRVDTHLVSAGDRSLGDVYTYELRQTAGQLVVIEFLFGTGATILLDCERITLRVQRLARREH